MLRVARLDVEEGKADWMEQEMLAVLASAVVRSVAGRVEVVRDVAVWGAVGAAEAGQAGTGEGRQVTAGMVAEGWAVMEETEVSVGMGARLDVVMPEEAKAMQEV